MNNYTKIVSIITFILLFSMTCHPQNQDALGWYTAQIDGKELSIHLVSDSTYEAISLWDTSYGSYDIIAGSGSPDYDFILFYDETYGWKSLHYFYHKSISQEDVKKIVDSDLYKEDSFYVAMLDLTGEYVTYYSVCFSDSTGKLLFCDNNKGNNKAHSIPLGTSRIAMYGDKGNFATNFMCHYDRSEGSIVFIVGPCANRFFIKKDRSCIMYPPVHCDPYNFDCHVPFIKEPVRAMPQE